ncbi:hypothetical protein PEC331060_06970 [Pectobacterium carotovorum subsp. carotovorum]|nr:hypothetical protein PEC331060_06970 [Pectobacterium carotovorum subsp. carotovorum]
MGSWLFCRPYLLVYLFAIIAVSKLFQLPKNAFKKHILC